MASIPVYNRPQVQERAAPNVRVGAEASAAAFGGGDQAAIENVGRAFDVVSDTFAKAKQDADTTFAQSKVIGLKNIKNALLNDPNKGALYTKGQNAFGIVDTTLADFDKAAQQAESEAQNDDQRMMIRQVAQSYKSDLNNDLMKHVGKEGQAFQEQVADNGIKAAADEAFTNYNDPEKVAKNLQEVESYALDKARRNGWDGGSTKFYVQAEKSKVLSGILERKLNNGDDIGASEFFKSNREMFSGEDASKMEKVLEEGSLRGESQRLTDSIMGAGLGPQAAIDKAKEIENPKLRDEVLRRTKDEFSNRDFVRRQREEERSVSVANILDKNPSFDAIPPSMVANMSDTERTRWRTYAANKISGKDVPENSKEYYNLKLMAGNAETRSKFLQTNLLEYATTVKGSQLSELIKDQADARAGKGDAIKKFDGFQSDMQVATAAMKDIGLKDDSEEGRAFMRALDQRVAMKSASKGDKLTNEEIRTEANNLSVQVVTDKGYLWNTRKRAYELGADDKLEEVDVKTIPRAEVTGIDAALKRAGKPVNDQNRAALYLRMLGSRRGN